LIKVIEEDTRKKFLNKSLFAENKRELGNVYLYSVILRKAASLENNYSAKFFLQY
jgi:hypothetical protein